MAFNSISFALFFAALFAVYWMARGNLRTQNVVVLAGSYGFYVLADWRMLPLLVGSSALFFALGLLIAGARSTPLRRAWLSLAIAAGLTGLLFFKYADFLLQSFVSAASVIGIELRHDPLQILLPLGISFFTFRNLSYALDVHARRIEPTRDWLAYFGYVAFFPCLMAGPIDRAGALIPQLHRPRVFDYQTACDGVAQVAWGLFKKVVVADNCGSFADRIFADYQRLPASSLALGAFFFTMQLYADFSGYSDMAVGLARLLGFEVARNFDNPFFSRNIAEFWRKWHISLTSWMTDYVYTPLAIQLRDLGKAGLAAAILVNFTLLGIWHGANWTFVLFGFVHGCLFVPLILRGTAGKVRAIPAGRALPSARDGARMLLTFVIVTLTLVIFRSATVADAVQYLARLASPTLFSMPELTSRSHAVLSIGLALFMLAAEWLTRVKPFPTYRLGYALPTPMRWSFYYAAVVFVFLSAGTGKEFIYVQF